MALVQIKCPNCDATEMSYDEFEDMYCCVRCLMADRPAHWYPSELNIPQSANAGYLKIGN